MVPAIAGEVRQAAPKRSSSCRRSGVRARGSCRSHSGTPGSATRSVRAGTPALRKYFCASTSTATCDQPSGARRSFISKTTLPSGLAIREVRGTKLKAAKGSRPSAV